MPQTINRQVGLAAAFAFIAVVTGAKSTLAGPLQGTDDTDAGQLAAVNQLKIPISNGSLAKALWYIVGNSNPSNGEGDRYSIYDYNRPWFVRGYPRIDRDYSASAAIPVRLIRDPGQVTTFCNR